MSAKVTGNFRATGNVRTFRAVTVDGDGKVAESSVGEICIGVTDGTSVEFDSANHAKADDVVRLQTGDVVQVTTFGAVSPGDILENTISGLVRAWTITGQHFGVALEEATASGQVIRCRFNPTYAI